MITKQRQLVYIGTYTHLSTDLPHRTESIYIYEFDPYSGKLDFRNIIFDVVNPSFLAISSDRQHLFAVSEVAEFSDVAGGGVSAFALNPQSSQPSFINSQPTYGTYPCYITLDTSGQWALVANYGGGSITILSIAADGQFGAPAIAIQNQGRSIHPTRQNAPHAHCIVFDPGQRYAFVADLGIDQILIFRFDAASGQLSPHDSPSIATEPGAGPRHLEFHPTGCYLYVTNELNSTIGVYDYDSDQGTLKHQQTISTIPDDFGEPNFPADLHVTGSGLFLYASNRGHDSMAVFTIDPQQGFLSLVETISSGGLKPRNFAIDLTDNFLLVANQDSHNLIVFKIDKSNGRLTPTTSGISIPSPVCIKIVTGNRL
ncbi:MAG: lactonase family protein [Anaerolineae bacterium]|nr:lactonase family protein [Anaerolineae bacterium]